MVGRDHDVATRIRPYSGPIVAMPSRCRSRDGVRFQSKFDRDPARTALRLDSSQSWRCRVVSGVSDASEDAASGKDGAGEGWGFKDGL